jgi:hypothetical protein
MTTAQTTNIPVSVNYTGRDFYAIRNQLITRIQDRVPEWTGSDPSDFGVVLVEAFSYMGDLLSYYIDRTANETSILTATQRANVLNLAQTYGYTPSGYRQSFVEITITNSSDTDVTLPVGTVVSGQVATADKVQDVYFTLIEEALITAESSYTMTATEGVFVPRVVADADPTYGEKIGESTGQPSMSFELGEVPVVDGSVSIYIQDGDRFSKWEEVPHLPDYDSLSQIYSLSTDESNVVSVNFGDGISGVIPVIHSEIRAMYTVGGGVIGNVAPGIIDELHYVPGLSEAQTTALSSVISVTNETVAVGGSDVEPTDQIREAASSALRASNRAVTLEDFKDIALSVSGVGKAQAEASVWSSISLYIAPSRGDNDTDAQPGLDEADEPTPEFDTIKENVESFLEDKVLIGTTVTVLPPTYVDCVIAMSYVRKSQYTTTEVEKSLKLALLTIFGYNGMAFKDTVYPQDIENALVQSVGSVKTVKVTILDRLGTTGLTTLQGAADEIFRFKEANVNIGPLA